MRLFSVVLCLAFSAPALAVPTTLSHQGRLFDSGGLPLDGSHSMELGLHDAPAGGTEVWSENLSAVDFDNGYFSVVLGEATPVDDATLTGSVLYLSLGVDGGADMPGRVQVNSVPYAVQAGSVRGGIVDADEVRVNGTTVIDSDGQVSISSLPLADTLSELACSAGDVAAFDGSDWACTAIAHEHDAAELTSGTLDIGRLPVGTASDQIAAGDHAHTAADVGALSIDGGTLAGGLIIGDTSDSCSDSIAGMLKFDGESLSICSEDEWVPVFNGGYGTSATTAGLDCRDILAVRSGSSDGTYWIDPDTTGTPFMVECDMAGGGWTRLVPEFKSYSWQHTSCGGSSEPDCVPDSITGHTPHQRFGNSVVGVITYLDEDGTPIPDGQLTALAARTSDVNLEYEAWTFDTDAGYTWSATFNYADGTSSTDTASLFCQECWEDHSVPYQEEIENAGILISADLRPQANHGLFLHFLDSEMWVK